MKMKTRKPKAFTIIEVLIVISIIAILVAIAVPNFQEAQKRSKEERERKENGGRLSSDKAWVIVCSDDKKYYTFEAPEFLNGGWVSFKDSKTNEVRVIKDAKEVSVISYGAVEKDLEKYSN